jgi:soluble lytic murein transglycosylase
MNFSLSIMKKFLILISFLFIITTSSRAQVYNDATLAKVISLDQTSRNETGQLNNLGVSVHMYRADVYMSNRQFSNARQHWEKVLAEYPNDENIPKALFGMGRSNMWERKYETAIIWFDKLVKNFLSDKEWGHRGLAYKGACYVRLGKNLEAAETYEQYTVMFPYGQFIESSHLNILDAYRENQDYDKATQWVVKTRKRFTGTSTETNALHAQLRMEVYRKNWNSVITISNELLRLNNFEGSMAFENEVKFIKGFALEKSGQNTQAISTYLSIPESPSSYYGGLATDRIADLGGNTTYRNQNMKDQSRRVARLYPVRFRSDLLRYSKPRDLDPRFLLAIMKQESSFKPNAKSFAAARGLLQLTYDTALKYNKQAGFNQIKATDLYRPNINIAIGSVYISKLKNDFGGLYEAIAASYNGGEDNVARWLARTEPKESGIFASEVGFSETKKYVYKVMSNYRVYQELYTENLLPK